MESNKRRGSVVVSRARKGGTLMSACHLKVKRNIFSVPQENPTPAYRLPVYPTKTGKQRKELDFFFLATKFRHSKQQHTLPALVIEESKSRPAREPEAARAPPEFREIFIGRAKQRRRTCSDQAILCCRRRRSRSRRRRRCRWQ